MTKVSVVAVNTCAAAVLAVILGGCAVHGATSGRFVIKDDSRVVDVRFSNYDRDVIERYFISSKRKGLPPGLAKRGGNLPPGLARRDRLPPGLQAEPLPHDLEAKLSGLPEGYIRVRIGGDVVLLDRSTRVVFDVIYNVAN
jgi:hypothetical protein